MLEALLLFSFLAFDPVDCLLCHKCNDMVIGSTTCQNSNIDDCDKSFPQQKSVCLKTVNRFSDRPADPVWIFAQCQILEAFEPEQLDNCTTTAVAKGSLTSCACTEDLCDLFSFGEENLNSSTEHGNLSIVILPTPYQRPISNSSDKSISSKILGTLISSTQKSNSTTGSVSKLVSTQKVPTSSPTSTKPVSSVSGKKP